ncbi:MAG: hypothetical protein KIT27_06800 [Legionellales bacterium]|nr:hypothetical protein [Legionellales bacterium]
MSNHNLTTHSPSEILHSSISRFGQTWLNNFALCLLIGIITVAPALIFPNIASEHFAQIETGVRAFLPYFFPYVLILLFLHCWLILRIYHQQHHLQTQSTELFRLAFKKFPFFLCGFIIFMIAGLSGLLILIIPGIILLILLSQFPALILLEHYHPWKALTSSIAIVKHYWWRTFLLLILGGIISLILTLLIDSAFRETLVITHSATQAPLYLSHNFAKAFAMTAFLPWYYRLYLALFDDLKLRSMESGII